MTGYHTVYPAWRGETVYLIGCGPSVRPADVDRLRGRRVIAINDSVFLAPWADVCYACDARWWQTRAPKLTGYRGFRVTLADVPETLRLRNTGETGLETEPNGLRTGKNSGYQAINLAYHLGASRIVLLGYDMRVVGGALHWSARPELQTAAGFSRTLAAMLPMFDTLVEPLRAAGVEVLNATPGSALRCWPMVWLEDVMTAVVG